MSRRWIELLVLGAAGTVAVLDGVRSIIATRGTPDAWQDGSYTVLLGFLLIFLAIVNWFQTGSLPMSTRLNPKSERSIRLVLIAFAILVGYVLLIEHLGYLLSTALLGVVYLRVFSSRGWAQVLCGSVVAAVATSYLWVLTGMMLPKGILPWP